MAKTKQQQTDIKIYNNMQIIYTFNIYFKVQVLYRTEPNRTDPNRTEPNRTEQNRTEPNKTEQNRTEYLFCLSIYSLSQLQSYKMHGLLNIHIYRFKNGLKFKNGFKFWLLLNFLFTTDTLN